MGSFKKILQIGKQIDLQKAHYEFIGMFLLSKSGLEMLKGAWERALNEFKSKQFYEAPNVAQASMTDLFQYVIDQGIEVHGLVIEHGWSEIYALDDYERLNQYFGEQATSLLYSVP